MPRISWPIAIAVSLLIHGGLAIGYWQSRPAPHQGGAIGEGEYGFEIGLGMAGSYTDAARVLYRMLCGGAKHRWP